MPIQRVVKWGNEYCLTDKAIYECPAGFTAGKGQVVLPKYAADAAIDGGPQTVTFSDGETTLELKNMYPVEARRVSPTSPTDSTSAMILTFSDPRILGWMSDTDSIYSNIRAKASGDDYLEYGDAPPTDWDQLISDIWDGLPEIWGSVPDVPSSLTGDPDCIQFDGIRAIDALCAVCTRLSITLIYDPISGNFSFAKLGASQSLPTNTPDYPEYDSQVNTNTSISVPEKIAFYFNEYWRNYGTELDAPADPDAPGTEKTWQVKPPYSREEKDVGASDYTAGTTLAMWEDMRQVYDAADSDDNTPDRDTRASEVAANYVADVSTPDIDKIYNKLVPFVCGGSIKGVTWSLSPTVQTHVVGGAGGYWTADANGGISREPFMAPDITRVTHPNTPRIQQVIRVYDSGGTQGEFIDPNGDGYFPGFLITYRQGTMHESEPIWIQLIDDEDSDTDTNARDGEYLIGRLTGTAESGGTTQPLYMARRGRDDLFRFVSTASMSYANTSVTADILDESLATMFSATVYEAGIGKWGKVASGAHGWAVFKQDSGKFEIVFMEGQSRFIKFTLTGSLAGGSSGASVQYDWGFPTNGITPVGSITVYDLCSLYAARESGDEGVCVWDEQEEKHIIYDMLQDGGSGGTTPGTTLFVQWGELQSDPAGGPPPFATVWPTDNKDGDNPAAGGAVTVYFPLPDDHIISAEDGDIIAYAKTISGEYVCVSDYSFKPTYWAKASEDWTRDVGMNANYVMCHPCDDKDGTGEDAGVDLKIWLPGPLSNYDAAYELIEDNQVIAYTVASDGELVCVSDYSPKNIHIKLTTNWISNGDTPYVQGNPCLVDGTGVDASTVLFANISGITADEYWSRSCPNLVKDSVVAIQPDSEGLNVVVGDALDAPLATIRMLGQRTHGDFSTRLGWVEMDGAMFSTDTRGRVPRGWDAGETSDSEVEGDGGTYDAPCTTGGDDDAAVQIDGHDNHEHVITGGSPVAEDDGTGTINEWVSPTDSGQDLGGGTDFLGHAGDMRQAFFTVKYVVRVQNSENTLVPAPDALVAGTDIANATTSGDEVTTIPNIEVV